MMVNRILSLPKVNHHILEDLRAIRLYLLKPPHVLETHHMVELHLCAFPCLRNSPNLLLRPSPLNNLVQYQS